MAAEIVNPRSDSESRNGPTERENGAEPLDSFDPAFALHRGGKMAVQATVPIRDKDDLSLAYTPGVAKVCSAIAEQPDLVHDYTWKSSVVAVVTDGTAVLGLGDIGPEASLPVMEGKAILFKQFGGVDAVPLALNCTDVDEIVETVVRLAPSFGTVPPEPAVASMAEGAFVFAMANPDPEVHPEVAHKYAAVVATGRSDFPNQINNVLAFPGIFAGALQVRASRITEGMKLAAAEALASVVGDDLAADYVIPSPFDERVAPAVTAAVAAAARAEGVARR